MTVVLWIVMLFCAALAIGFALCFALFLMWFMDEAGKCWRGTA